MMNEKSKVDRWQTSPTTPYTMDGVQVDSLSAHPVAAWVNWTALAPVERPALHRVLGTCSGKWDMG